MWCKYRTVVKDVSLTDEKNLAAIDNFDAQSFNINEVGVIRNDISKLARAQSQSEFDAVMKKIGTSPASYNIKDGMTLQQAFDSLKPRHLQSPCELANFAEYMANQDAVYGDVKVPGADVNQEQVSPDGSVSSES